MHGGMPGATGREVAGDRAAVCQADQCQRGHCRQRRPVIRRCMEICFIAAFCLVSNADLTSPSKAGLPWVRPSFSPRALPPASGGEGKLLRMSLLSLRPVHVLAVAAIAFAATLPGSAQSRATVTADDYQRAEKFLGYNTTPLVVERLRCRPTWLPGDRFWYRNQGAGGAEFFLVDAVEGDQGAGVQSRGGRGGADHRDGQAGHGGATALHADHLRGRPASRSRSTATSSAGPATCRASSARSVDRPARVPNSELSPDGKLAAFIRDHNLWVRDIATGQDTQLTTDGVKDYGYATDNAGWTISDRPVAEVVARLEEDRDLPAGSAQGRRDVSGQHRGGPSDAEGVEVPAARR